VPLSKELSLSKKLRICVHGGYGEVGGNIIEIAYKDESIILDLGLNLSLKSRFYTWPTFDVENPNELFELGITKNIEGLYTSWDGPFTPSKGYETRFLGAFISHAHLDHIYMLPQVNRNIPIFMGETCKIIYDARKETSRRKRFWIDIGLRINTYRSFLQIKLGEFNVLPIHVDHSIPGAYAFIVGTPDGVIAYSGDYRLHGTSITYYGEKSLTMDFVNKLEEEDVNLLISEATRFEDVSLEHEKEVESKISHLLESCSGAVLTLFSETDIDRFKSFLNAAIKNDWKILIPLRQFKILYDLMNKDERLRLKIPKDIVYAFIRRKARLESWEDKVISELEERGFSIFTFPDDFDEKGLKRKVIVGFNLIRRELMKVGLPSNTLAILSYSEPADEEGEIELDKLLNWLRNYSIPSYRIHCSGHIYMKDLVRIVNYVKPKDILIVHSEYPEIVKRYLGY